MTLAKTGTNNAYEANPFISASRACVVSSNISSSKALRYARKMRTRVSQPRKVLLVAMPSTPGHQSLDITLEKQILQANFTKYLTTKQHPTGSEVLSELSHYSILHLACCGYLSALPPSDSSLVFAHD